LVNRNFLSQLAFFASFFALCVIALGAFTRLIDAGLGCPDWPGCYGQLSVPLTELGRQVAHMKFPNTRFIASKAWAEMIHRYFVGALSIMILTLVTLIFTSKSLRVRSNIILALGLVLLLVYQILLGQWTVTWKLLPLVVSQHLLGGFFVLATLWLIYLNNIPMNDYVPTTLTRKTRNFLLPFAFIALLLLVLQMCLGAWTSTNYASLSCPDFPFCYNHATITLNFTAAFNLFSHVGVNYEGGVLPESARQTIQMTHRLGAVVLTVYMLVFMLLVLWKLKHLPELMAAIYLVLGLLCIQLCIGISNIIFQLPLSTALSHNLFAVLLFLALITFTFKLANTPCGDRQV
jgi:cytochrome c oxidase assembly protein subunit 15